MWHQRQEETSDQRQVPPEPARRRQIPGQEQVLGLYLRNVGEGWAALRPVEAPTMILGFCSCCGDWAVVHGHKDRGVLLCDRCCPCYNHGPPLGEHHEAGKYWSFTMTEHWYREALTSLTEGSL